MIKFVTLNFLVFLVIFILRYYITHLSIINSFDKEPFEWVIIFAYTLWVINSLLIAVLMRDKELNNQRILDLEKKIEDLESKI